MTYTPLKFFDINLPVCCLLSLNRGSHGEKTSQLICDSYLLYLSLFETANCRLLKSLRKLEINIKENFFLNVTALSIVYPLAQLSAYRK
jgi:hypothetical protein